MHYLCAVIGIKTRIYSRAEDLPQVEEGNFFHSRQLFLISASTPKMKPYMVVCYDEAEQVVSQLLATVRYRTSFLPPFIFMHCRVIGEGTYAESDYKKEDLFGEMLTALTKKLNKKTLYIEVSNLSHKMFGSIRCTARHPRNGSRRR